MAVGGSSGLEYRGLAVVYQFGELANKLMHPRFGLEREYAVRVGALSNEEKSRLLEGCNSMTAWRLWID